jgi:hypothetical protein
VLRSDASLGSSDELDVIEPDVRISRIRLSAWLHLEAHDGRLMFQAFTVSVTGRAL